MSDLLVSSLMADGGLEAAILAAIKVEVRDLEECSLEKEGERDKPAMEEHLITEQALLEAETKRTQEVRLCIFLNLLFANLLKFKLQTLNYFRIGYFIWLNQCFLNLPLNN